MYSRYLKRMFDILFAVMLLILLAPLFLILFIIVKWDSPGPFLFIQVRIGRHLKPFKIFKIRTMSAEAGIRANDPTITYETTKQNDPRITRSGKILRKTHLDELPQLLNVIKGDMSFIGVRPDAPSQIADYDEAIWHKRHLMRPGITGLSQIQSGNPNFNASARTKFDLHYVRQNGKFVLDVYIVLKTVVKLFRINGL